MNLGTLFTMLEFGEPVNEQAKKEFLRLSSMSMHEWTDEEAAFMEKYLEREIRGALR